MLDSIFVLAICIAAGAVVNGWIDMPLPGFLTAIFVGILITSGCPCGASGTK